MDSARDFGVLCESPGCPRLDSQSDFSTVPAVAIADEILGGLSVCERLYDLLRCSSPGRMLRHIEMQHLATVVFQQDKHKEHSHGNCGTVKKSMETNWPTWLCRKVRHVWFGGRRSLRRMRDTVRSEMAMPSIWSSP